MFGLALFVLPQPAGAQWSAAQKAACQGDAMRLCSQSMADPGQLSACIRETQARSAPAAARQWAAAVRKKRSAPRWRSGVEPRDRSGGRRTKPPEARFRRGFFLMHEGALLALAGAIIGTVQKADGAIPPRDRRMVLGFVRTLSRVGPRGPFAVGQARAAWQRIPAVLRHQIADLATAAGCTDELGRVIG